ncbi:MAG: thioredoxin family protein [Candidatus Marinimicrobia bacterium]|nr:thioredoxin family protein [Candidatus Neomarinimicrobiota bacterium]MCF7904785.1 thioredoxin family protein [Candidatus Neomarinimicrobiota bacterium]
MEQLQAILTENKLTLLYFSTPACNVCKVLRPKVEELVKDVSPWHFEYINSEESMEIAGQHMVFAAPTILLMAEGREIGRFSRHFGMDELEVPIRRYAEFFTS